ncbi:MAG: helix-turn-helix transcriptional regulator [Promethearchaeota archaeon]
MPKEAVGRVLDRYEIDTKIVECITLHPKSTIDFISKETNLSYTAVRNSLTRLTSLGVVIQTDQLEGSGRRGRPAARFRLDKGLQILIPPRHFQHLATVLIDQLIEKEGVAQVEKLLDRAGQVQATKLVAAWKEDTISSSLRSVLQRISKLYNSIGGYSQVRRNQDGFYLEVKNCVYGDVAAAYPHTICRYHESLIANILLQALAGSSVTVKHEQVMAVGDHQCQFRISSS